MDFTLDDIVATMDAKIGSIKAEITVLQERLQSLMQARKALVPEDSEGTAPDDQFEDRFTLSVTADGFVTRGTMRRLALDCLPDGGEGITIRDLMKRMEERGFAFRSRNPEVSLNEILQFFSGKGQAKIVRRTISGNYWVRVNQAQEESHIPGVH